MPVVCLKTFVDEWASTMGLKLTEEEYDVLHEQVKQQCLCDECQKEEEEE